MEELVGIATPIRNGLINKEFASDILVSNNSKAVLLHKSQSIEWGNFGFQLAASGGGYNDASVMIAGTNNITPDKGEVFIYEMSSGSRLDQIGKFYYRQNQDLSIEVYFVSVKEGLGYRTFYKQPFYRNISGFQMSEVDSINMESLKEIKVG